MKVFAGIVEARAWHAGRKGSLLLSAILHAALVFGLRYLPERLSIYLDPPRQVAMEPDREKYILYYTPDQLPAITPAQASESATPAVPDALAVQALESVADTPTDNQTRVYLPETPPEVQPELDVANLIVIPQQPLRRTPARAYVPPAPKSAPKELISIPDPPAQLTPPSGLLQPSTTLALSNLPDAPRPPEPAEPAPGQVSSEPSTTPAEASATVAVVSPKPSAASPEKMPTSSAEASFRVGPPVPRDPNATGLAGVDGAAAAVPNLAIAQPKGRPSPGSPSASATAPVAPVPRPTPPPVRTMASVAMRPGARRLPGQVEAVFGPRSVYVVLLETKIRNVRGADWTLWFSETDDAPAAQMSLIRPPVPMLPIPAWPLGAESSAAKRYPVYLKGVIRKAGTFEASAAPAEERSDKAAAMLKEAQFLPASKNGAPIDVDVMVQVQFAEP